MSAWLVHIFRRVRLWKRAEDVFNCGPDESCINDECVLPHAAVPTASPTRSPTYRPTSNPHDFCHNHYWWDELRTAIYFIGSQCSVSLVILVLFYLGRKYRHKTIQQKKLLESLLLEKSRLGFGPRCRNYWYKWHEHFSRVFQFVALHLWKDVARNDSNTFFTRCFNIKIGCLDFSNIGGQTFRHVVMPGTTYSYHFIYLAFDKFIITV